MGEVVLHRYMSIKFKRMIRVS